jgi:choline dehydrogenase-like flavoprotein
MERIVVVGSGASGVHFALSCLLKGRAVTMIDVGFTGREFPRAEDSLVALKRNLPDPVDYFLGSQYGSLALPGRHGEYYAFPPAKDHVFQPVGAPQVRANGFSPLYSFAAGGLAEVWTGGCYPFDERDLSEFPFGWEGLEPYYTRVAERIGISGSEDDLKSVLPLHGGLQPPLEPDEHSAELLAAYGRNRERLNGPLGCLMGRARVAVLSRDLDGRKACSYSGRCLWGCPRQSLYTPSITLARCRAFSHFQYLSGLYADHFRMDGSAKVRAVFARRADGKMEEIPADTLVLAAGTLGSAKIFLESIHRDSGQILSLDGLMDNRQVLMPFVNLRMLGRKWNPDTYQYHQIAMAVRVKESGELIHGLITTLKTALIHPLVQTLPFDLAGSLSAFRSVHAALGMININFPDRRRAENYVTLDTSSTPHRLAIYYRPDATEPVRLAQTIAAFRKVLRKLGCFAPKPMTHVRPMGASVHYAGTLPMSKSGGARTCSTYGASRDVQGLYFADGTTFPSLPAKNLTFTLMANATRIAEEAF